ncbi:MAG: hypothetical protein OIF55_05190 [Amphritea sp.]|nr:hypothetical protein [Amphritea sp.]
MPEQEQVDVMSLLLNEDVDDDIEELEQLNNLIFSDAESLLEDEATIQGELIWQNETDKFAVQVKKVKGKISLNFITKSKSDVSVQRLAKVALHAILEDLKKAKP